MKASQKIKCNLKRPIVLVLFCSLFLFAGCSGSNGGFSNLVGGDLSEVSELTIISSTPAGLNPVIQIGDTQAFSILAQTPPPNSVSYSWTLDGTPVSSTNAYSLTGTALNVGNHPVVASATDGIQTKSVTWNVKVNGPPVITPVTTGIPKASIYDSIGAENGSTTTLAITATDPNSDTLTYTWTLNGAASAYLVPDVSGLSATLTGNVTLVGTNTITVSVSDGSVSDTHNFTVQVNYFPQACNDLAQGEMCSFAGNPSLGDGLNPNSSQWSFINIAPIAVAVDDIGNLFVADYGNNLVWYWNKTASSVTRVGVSVPANTFKVVAGTGEYVSGPDGIALESAIAGPRGLAYYAPAGRLYVSEWSGSRVKVIDNSGNISQGMGAGGGDSTTDASAYLQACTNPAGLYIDTSTNFMYVACYGSNRIRRWDLTTDQAKRIDTSSGNPYGVFVSGSNLYATYYGGHIIRKGTLDASGGLSVAMAPLIGTGVVANDNNLAMASNRIVYPTGIVVKSNRYFVCGTSSDWIMVGNNTGGTISYGSVNIVNGNIAKISNTSGAFNGDRPINTSNFYDPWQLAEDPNDSNIIYISDYSNRRIRKLDLTTLQVTSVLGSGELRNGNNGSGILSVKEHKLDYPSGLAFDNATSDLFIMDSNNYRIMKVDKYGQANSVLGNGAGAPSIPNDLPTNTLLQTNSPVSINQLEILADSTLAFANSRYHNFRLWNRSGSDKTYLSVYTFNNRVQNIAGDYLNGAQTGVTRQPDNVGDPASVALSTSMNYPGGIAFYDNAGTYEGFFADTYNHCIRHVDGSGNLTTIAGKCGTAGAGGSPNSDTPDNMRFSYPQGLIVDSSNGNLIIADRDNARIKYFNRTGSSVSFAGTSIPGNTVKTIACNNGTSGTSAENQIAVGSRCGQVVGLAMNADNLCYSQLNHHNVRCIYLNGANLGRVRTVAGAPEATYRAGIPYNYSLEGLQGTQQFLYSPTGLAFDASGDLYISDSSNHLIKKVKLSP